MRTPLHTGETEENLAMRKRRTQFSVRINFFFFATFLLFSTLLVQLAIIQFVHGEELSAQEKLGQNQDVAIAPIRGNIYDSNGFPLAYTISSQSLFYQLKVEKTQQETIDLARRLADAFYSLAEESKKEEQPGVEEVLALMDTGWKMDSEKQGQPLNFSFSPRRIKTNLTQQEIAYFAERRDEFDGIEITEESTREYNSNNGSSIAAQVLGYLRQFSTANNPSLGRSFLDFYKGDEMKKVYPSSDELVGFDGLEFMYQTELRGQSGKKTYRINSRAQIMGQVELVAPVKGNNLHLTINKDVQQTAEKAIESHLAYMKSPAARGTYAARGANAVAGYAVALEVDTGKVIAMANYPSYDPNIWQNGRISTEKFNEIQFRFTNGTLRERNGEYPNPEEFKRRPSSLVYLGSTMKPLSVLIGLSEGIITANERYRDPSTFYFGKDRNAKVSNSDNASFGELTAATAIQKSSNTYMAEMIGNRMYLSKKYPPYPQQGNAVDVWDSYVKKFGLGSSTGSGFPGESEGLADYIAAAKRDGPQPTMIYSSFGQQGKYTTLQLAQYASMLANQGKRYKPQFVEKITTYDQELVKAFEPVLLDEVNFPASYWDVLKQGMQSTVQGFEGAAYTLVRKTGTSEQQVPAGHVDNAVLIAYAPAEKPKLAVAVVVPEGGFGSWGAAPIARQIFDAYDQQIGLDGKPKGEPKQQEGAPAQP